MYAQARPSKLRKESDRQQDKLVGPVQSVRLESLKASMMASLFGRGKRSPLRSASYHPNGNKIRVVTYNAGSSENCTELFSYDELGRRTEWILRQGPTVVRSTYFYADKENKIEVAGQVTNGDNVTLSRSVSTFDSNGNEVEARYSDDSGIETFVLYEYRYDDAANIIEVSAINSATKPYHRVAYRYDLNGDVVEESLYGHDEALYDRTVFVYERRKKTTERRWIYKADNGLLYGLVTSFDDRGNVVEVARYDEREALLAKTSHCLDYDVVGNWIKRTTQCLDVSTGRPGASWTEYQVIDYY